MNQQLQTVDALPLRREAMDDAVLMLSRGASPQAAGPSLDLGSYWRVLRKHRWLIIAITTIVLCMATIWCLKTTRIYRANAHIVINRENTEALGFKDLNTASSDEDTWDYKVAIETDVRILESDMLALQVIHQLQLDRNTTFNKKAKPVTSAVATVPADDPKLDAELLKTFHDNLSVSVVPRTRMLEIEYLSPDPKLAAQILNALVNAFVEQNFKAKYEATMQTSEWLQTQLADLQRKVETSQQKLVDYQRANNILGLDDKQNITTSKLDQLNRDLTTAQTDRIQKQANYELTKSGSLELIPGLADNKIVQSLQDREADLGRLLAEATTKFGPSYPKVQELRQQLQQVRSSLQAEIQRVAGRLQNEYRAAVERERMLSIALQNQKGEANKLNDNAIEYNIIKREYESNRQLYDDLLAKLKEASVSAGLRSNNVRVVDVARVPDRPAKPNVPLTLAVALLMSLTVGAALAFILEGLDHTVHHFEDIETFVHLPALASIPAMAREKTAPRKPARGLLQAAGSLHRAVMLEKPKSQMAEAYRSLRTSLLLSSSGAPPKVILVTSALAEEGKTTTSVNTAIVLAQHGKRVLLVDADLRRPRVHEHFGLPAGTGLSALLAGAVSDASVEIEIPTVPNLWVVTAGTPPPYPAELLGSATMRENLQRWRSKFDHVVIDTPPVLSVTDAAALSVQSDGVLIVARAGQTSKLALRHAHVLLQRVQARLLGVVLNDVQSRDGGYYYNSYYRYGYSAKAYSYYEDAKS